MQLEHFTYLHPDARSKTLEYLARTIAAPDADPEALWEELARTFTIRYERGELNYFHDRTPTEDESRATSVEFRTGFRDRFGHEIVAKCERNRNPEARQRWFGLWFEVRAQGYIIGDLHFPTWQEGHRFLEELADMAVEERWTYKEYPSKQPYPILRSYVEHTYRRLREQGKLLQVEGRVLFNTGLVNRFFKEVYVVCDVAPDRPGVLINARPVLENDWVVLGDFRNQKPPLATYAEEMTELLFDPELDIITNDQHILLDNFERIPAKYHGMPKSQIFALFQSAIQFARIVARRNYKLVVPNFYGGKIGFLMPIYLSGELSGVPDFALALEKVHDCYRGNTILTLDMAYQNARLIAQPDPTWLNPDAITVSAADPET